MCVFAQAAPTTPSGPASQIPLGHHPPFSAALFAKLEGIEEAAGDPMVKACLGAKPTQRQGEPRGGRNAPKGAGRATDPDIPGRALFQVKQLPQTPCC